MYKYKLILEYDGTKFFGFQRQKTPNTVEGALFRAINKLTGESPDIVSAGRTDSGVHALGQVVSFEISKNFDATEIRKALNANLDIKAVSVVGSENLGEGSTFNARFSAKERTYEYKIYQRANHLTFQKNLFWWVKPILEVDLMREAASFLIGTYDFSSFRASGCQAKSPIKTINSVIINHTPLAKHENLINIEIKAPSFLYHQVRNIVGTLYYVGLKRITPSQFKEILEEKDRTKAGITAPPHGLYFVNVKY